MTINELLPSVRKKLRGRDDLDDDIPGYIRDAILDLSQNYEFEELRVTGPLTNFILNQAEYLKEGSNNPFINPGDKKLTFIVTWFVYYSATVVVGQSTGMEIKARTPRVVEPTSKIPGLPTYYCILGNRIIVGYLPNIAYATQMRYQRQHPFLPGDKLKETLILMPDDWMEIISYAAAEKGCDDIGLNDIGVLYHQKIYGNPMKKQPGIIAERLSQQQRDLTYNETQLRPIVRRSCR